MNKTLIKRFIIFAAIMLLIILNPNYSLAEPTTDTEGDTNDEEIIAQEFDATININFLNHDDTKCEFNNYDKLFELLVFSDYNNPFIGLEYEFVWSNGETGKGITDDEGKIVFKPSSELASNSVTITFKNCTQMFLIATPELDKTSYLGQKVSSDDYYVQVGYSGWNIYPDRTGSADISIYVMPPPATINIRFLHEDGSIWTLNESFVNPDLNIYNSLSYPIYYGEYNNSNTYEYSGNSIEFCGSNQYVRDVAPGSSELKLTVYGVDDETELHVSTYDLEEFSKVSINDVEYEFSFQDRDRYESVALKPGEIINLEYYIPETATGTICIQSYDGSLSDDFVWNLHFDMMEQSWTNQDYSIAYWTFDGDDTKYRPTKVDGEYAFDIQIPFGKKVTLHNLPIYSMFHNGESFKYNNLSTSNKISSFFKSPLSGKTVITYKGENLTNDILKTLGVYPGNSLSTYYFGTTKANDELIKVDTSGPINGFNMKDGFEINWYVFRNQTQLMFQKEYSDELETMEKDKKFHFRIKLTDPITKKPLSGKIAYYIYSDKNQVVDVTNDVNYATLDSEGNMDVYIKAGEYVRIGKELTDEEIIPKKLREHSTGAYDEAIISNTEDLIYQKYFNDLGMLPYGVEYEVTEVEDNYNSLVDREGAQKGSMELYYVGDYTNIKLSADQYYNRLRGFKFINNRKTGSLTIEKIVEGKQTDQKFKFDIKIKDSAIEFPLEYEYIDAIGNKGIISFVSEDKIISDNIEYTEYTTSLELKAGEKITINGLSAGAQYEVIESDEYSTQYNTEMINATGKIKPDDSQEKSIVQCINKEIIIEEDKEEKPESADKEEKPENTNKEEKPESTNKVEKPESTNKVEKTENTNKEEKPESTNKVEKNENTIKKENSVKKENENNSLKIEEQLKDTPKTGDSIIFVGIIFITSIIILIVIRFIIKLVDLTK